MRPDRSIRRRQAAVALALAMGALVASSGLAAAGGQREIAAVRQVTVQYHELQAALDDGYELFYVCTEEPGVGTMGQHFVKGSLVVDPAVDPLQPEVLVYAPERNGGYRLVAVEYVTLRPLWEAAFGATTPRIFGRDMELTPAGNRYGLPDFYERHLWLWQGNPSGLFFEWNPNVSCVGTGDNGG
ncbi:MAG TPA: hypothetical protein VNL94_09415 [Candidatus Binatia bacterium]|nr:hypothetical protein [Candidatus Binatia bacterium]